MKPVVKSGNLRVFLPDIALYQIEELGFDLQADPQLVMSPLSEDWQTQFCRFIGVPQGDLPWTRLRLTQFKIGGEVSSACCCDPVLMQLTHQGAYMLGQSPLELSRNDAIRVVAQINEKLMRKGEQLFLIDSRSWLFTSERKLALFSLPVKDLVGKDMFNYPYRGDDAEFWQKLSTEIQMLIKQMMDYQGLPPTQPETMMNVHFYDCVDLNDLQEIPFVKNESLSIFCENDLVKSFCMNSFLSHYSIQEVEARPVNNSLVVAFDNEREIYYSIIKYWQQCVEKNQFLTMQLICQDASITYNKKQNWFERVFRR